MSTQLFSLGSNGSGQLAIGHTDDVSVPTPCVFEGAAPLGGPCKVAAGGNHTLVFCDDGTVYASGENANGRCGLQSTAKSLLRLQKVQFVGEAGECVDSFNHVAATWEASIFVTATNKVYSCGEGRRGELGLGDSMTVSIRPQLIAGFPPENTKICNIAACMGHVVVVLSNGDVYGWGSGRKGQLGDPNKIVWNPRKIERLSFRAARAECGRDFTYILGAPDSGSQILIGAQRWNLGNMPASVMHWRDVSANWGSVHILQADGKVISWGRDDHGQQAPRDLPPVKSIVAGSEHIVATTIDDRIVSWGWGEHGNCGAPTQRNGDVKGYWNVFDVVNAESLGAGCATTWIVSKIA